MPFKVEWYTYDEGLQTDKFSTGLYDFRLSKDGFLLVTYKKSLNIKYMYGIIVWKQVKHKGGIVENPKFNYLGMFNV
jgi:hypothetical protein